LGGPSNGNLGQVNLIHKLSLTYPQTDIASWQVTASGKGSPLASGTGGTTKVTWTNSGETRTRLEIEMDQNLGIVIYEVSVTGRVDCVPPTPSPTGFWILALKKTGGNSAFENTEVVPDADIDCDTIVANKDKYIVFAEQLDGSVQVAPEQISTNSQGFKIIEQDNAPPCGIPNLSFVLNGISSGSNIFCMATTLFKGTY